MFLCIQREAPDRTSTITTCRSWNWNCPGRMYYLQIYVFIYSRLKHLWPLENILRTCSTEEILARAITLSEFPTFLWNKQVKHLGAFPINAFYSRFKKEIVLPYHDSWYGSTIAFINLVENTGRTGPDLRPLRRIGIIFKMDLRTGFHHIRISDRDILEIRH